MEAKSVSQLFCACLCNGILVLSNGKNKIKDSCLNIKLCFFQRMAYNYTFLYQNLTLTGISFIKKKKRSLVDKSPWTYRVERQMQLL